ncbi:acid phosphatase [uncultured Methylovirgula sp.]|uniref:acid phosphatase n=1 Tax=uncultured Methylovirgula sp. TaxID=1285960 RepID=UPI002603A1CB|nr:acid phosphatase [uncultured Methylovirgula sp.]
MRAIRAIGLLGAAFGALALTAAPAPAAGGLDQIKTIVILYAENRSFDALYGDFPGARGLADLAPAQFEQRDRDGKLLPTLPPIWRGLTGKHVVPPIPQEKTKGLPNAPFAIDDPKGFNLPLSIETRDLVHRFYQNQMQIDGGKNDRFAAYSDAGGLVMGHYDGSKLPLWPIAKDYVLADNFFMGAFGGSFLNHFELICACAPIYPHANESPAKDQISAINPDGVSLKLAADSPASALDGPPKFAKDRALTPDFYAVNTMQPPYQPSANPPQPGGDPALADRHAATTLPPQTETTIGDLLDDKNIAWAWYAGGWGAALSGKDTKDSEALVFHHQPFNYFKFLAPGTPARAAHLRDAGLAGELFIKDIDAGALPPVTFYKPPANLDEHPGYADVLAGDKHLFDIVGHLQKSPQWPHMVVIITYDENGGFWDHVAPPKGDRFGPGTRVPTLIVSPFAGRGRVDHTLYDTTSILRLITRRFGLPELAGLKARDAAMAKAGEPKLGDLTGALDLSGN